MKLVDFKQQEDKKIPSYIEKVEAIATKFFKKEFSIEIAIIRDINEPAH